MSEDRESYEDEHEAFAARSLYFSLYCMRYLMVAFFVCRIVAFQSTFMFQPRISFLMRLISMRIHWMEILSCHQWCWELKVAFPIQFRCFDVLSFFILALGSGKSALLANWVARRREHKHRDEFLFSHFVGCTTQSLQVRANLIFLFCELKLQ